MPFKIRSYGLFKFKKKSVKNCLTINKKILTILYTNIINKEPHFKTIY